MPGILYVVSTPIGNLEDVTMRGVRILREVAVIAAEDTRRTAGLLARYGLTTPTTSLHEHNEGRKTPALIARLLAGDQIALVSDAGTPGVSDPGMRLIQAAIAEGIPVTPVPGPSAILTALVGAGLPFTEFTFVGFPPPRSKDLTRWLGALAGEARPVVLFEAPHRVRATLAAMLTILGDRPITVGREMTKAHEEWLRGPVSEVLAHLANPRGEFTVVIPPAPAPSRAASQAFDSAEVYAEFCRLTENEGMNRRAAIAALAERHEKPAREIYKLVEEQKHRSVDQ